MSAIFDLDTTKTKTILWQMRTSWSELYLSYKVAAKNSKNTQGWLFFGPSWATVGAQWCNTVVSMKEAKLKGLKPQDTIYSFRWLDPSENTSVSIVFHF